MVAIVRAVDGSTVEQLDLWTASVNKACLVLPSSADDAVDAIECSGRNKQDVGRVDRDSITACTACAAIWNVDDGAFQKFQHALPATHHGHCSVQGCKRC